MEWGSEDIYQKKTYKERESENKYKDRSQIQKKYT